MMRKLVELDDDGWCMEIDPIKLKRVALEFKTWLQEVDPATDTFGFLTKDLPLVEAALNGTMVLPYKGFTPHSWEIREGFLPRDYLAASSAFYNTIRGAERSIETTFLNGKRHAWTEFEES